MERAGSFGLFVASKNGLDFFMSSILSNISDIEMKAERLFIKGSNRIIFDENIYHETDCINSDDIEYYNYLITIIPIAENENLETQIALANFIIDILKKLHYKYLIIADFEDLL